MKTDDLKRIAALVAVADNQSLTLAADRMGCSKAFLSQQIKKLENAYQVQLFHRTTRKLRLTEAGSLFVGECRQALRLLEQAEINLQAIQSSISGTIRMTCVGGTFGEQYIAPLVLSFMKEHPNIQVTLDFSSTHQDLVANDFDLAIRMGALDDSSLIARQLCLYKPTMVASQNYLERFGTPATPKDLQYHRIIAGSITHWSLKRGDESVEFKVSADLSCPNGYVMLNAAEQGLGIARLPSMYVQRSIDEGKLVAVLPEWHQTQSPCNIVYPPGRYRLERVKAFVDWLIKKWQAPE